MNEVAFTPAAPRPFTIAVDGLYDLCGVFDLELGANRYALLNRDDNRIEEFTDYDKARARFVELTTKG